MCAEESSQVPSTPISKEEGAREETGYDVTSTRGVSLSPKISDIQEPVVVLREAPSGRQYREWRSPAGRKATLIAALIPDGYRVSSADRDRFFTCPVRGCRGEFFSIHGVDMHFFKNHKAECFNDNLDGTLTLLGRTSDVKNFAEIISQKPLGSPCVERSIPSPSPAAEAAGVQSESANPALVLGPTSLISVQSIATPDVAEASSEIGVSGHANYRRDTSLEAQDERVMEGVKVLQMQVYNEDGQTVGAEQHAVGVGSQPGTPGPPKQAHQQEQEHHVGGRETASAVEDFTELAVQLFTEYHENPTDQATSKDDDSGGSQPTAEITSGEGYQSSSSSVSTPVPPEGPRESLARDATVPVTPDTRAQKSTPTTQGRRQSIRLAEKRSEKEVEQALPNADADVSVGRSRSATAAKTTPRSRRHPGPAPSTPRSRRGRDDPSATPTPGPRRSGRIVRASAGAAASTPTRAMTTPRTQKGGNAKTPDKPKSKPGKASAVTPTTPKQGQKRNNSNNKRKETPKTTPSSAKKRRLGSAAAAKAGPAGGDYSGDEDDDAGGGAFRGPVGGRTTAPFRRLTFHPAYRGPLVQSLARSQVSSGSASPSTTSLPWSLPLRPGDRTGGRALPPSSLSSSSSGLPVQPIPDGGVYMGLSVSTSSQQQQQQQQLPRFGGGGDVYELDGWEISPGMVADPYGTNMAFSSALLRSNVPRSIRSGTARVGVHNVVVSPGTAHRVDACGGEFRVVVVAAGRLRARLPCHSSSNAGGDGGEPVEFTVNVHGAVFVHPGGRSCGLQNRWATDAVVTIVTMPVAARV